MNKRTPPEELSRCFLSENRIFEGFYCLSCKPLDNFCRSMKSLRLSLIALALCCAFNACEQQPYSNVQKVDHSQEGAHGESGEAGVKASKTAVPSTVAHPKE